MLSISHRHLLTAIASGNLPDVTAAINLECVNEVDGNNWNSVAAALLRDDPKPHLFEPLRQAGARLDLVFADGSNMLIALAHGGGSAAMVDAVVVQGVDVHQRNAVGQSPLDYALSVPNLPVAAALLDNGADVNAPTKHHDMHGETPAQIMQVNGWTQTVEALRR